MSGFDDRDGSPCAGSMPVRRLHHRARPPCILVLIALVLMFVRQVPPHGSAGSNCQASSASILYPKPPPLT